MTSFTCTNPLASYAATAVEQHDLRTALELLDRVLARRAFMLRELDLAYRALEELRDRLAAQETSS